MPSTYTRNFDTPAFKGSVAINTGLFIGGKFVYPVGPATIDVINPGTGSEVDLPHAYERGSLMGITAVSIGLSKDVDIAVDAAKKAFKTSWRLKTPGSERGRLMNKLVDLLEAHMDELTALEALDAGKFYNVSKRTDVGLWIRCMRYYAGWADKIQGKTVETNEGKLAYTRREPFGVVGQIIPWNFPLSLLTWKVAPALATGNTIVLKPSELTPLSALKFAEFVQKAGFPAGVFNIVNGYGTTVGQAIAEHPQIEKVAFTGSTFTGRKILKAAADSNLKQSNGLLGVFSSIWDNAALPDPASSVQEGIYDEFMKRFSDLARSLDQATGDPFAAGVQHGPQISQTQFDRIMEYVRSGKEDGAKVHIGGEGTADKGYFIQPTIFMGVKADMKIVKEEIFGPVGVVIKFKTEEEVIEMANNTVYGLACNVFPDNISRALRVAHALEAGSAWVNCAQMVDVGVPFGGYKQSGIGCELGEAAVDMYTQIKSVHVNIGNRM